MEAVEKINLREQVMERIWQAVADGTYEPGDRLPSVSDLSSELGVSITSVRDALMQLEAVGLVDIRQGQGIFVNEIGPDFFTPRLSSMLLLERSKLLDLVEVRRAIEAQCARLAAERRSDDNLRRLSEIMDRMTAAIGDPDLYLREDLALHMVIAQISGNSIFPEILQLLRDLFVKELRATVGLPGAMETGYKHHRDIVMAIEDGDGQQAMEKMIEHLTYTEERLIAAISSQ